MSRLLDQPVGMLVLGCTEVFERLSYYTLSFLLVLYASAPIANGGLGWSKEASLILMGKYTFAAFTLPLIGGFITDRFLGTYRATLLGGFMIIAGHACMYFSDHGLAYFYTALVLVASGTAFFKPNMPTLLGALYAPTDARRAGGFNLYYMGINIGAMVAGFSGGLLLQHFGYQIALASAGLGMAVGMFVFWMGRKHLVFKAHRNLVDTTIARVTELTPTHKKALNYLMFSFIFYAIWAIAYNIASSGTLSIYIENFTQKTIFGYDIPTTFFSSLNPIAIIVFAPIVTAVLMYLAKIKRPFHFFSQMNLALILAFIAIAYFTYLAKVAGHASLGSKPFGYLGMSLFIILISLSEILISPVIMSAISVLAPDKYRTSFQAFYLSIIGIMGLVAGKIGAISISKPYETFYTLSVVTLIGTVIFVALNKVMVRAALNAAHELEKHKLH